MSVTTTSYSETPYSDLPEATYTPTYTFSSSSPTATFTGSEDYPVFPNGIFMSRFALVSADESGLTEQDEDLYDYCYIPSRPHNALSWGASPTLQERQLSVGASPTPRPTYLIDKPPCQRQAAINANCLFENTNGTFSGLSDPESPEALSAQQVCYCETYPFWDSVFGCQECFSKRGGIEGYHWYPEDWISAASSMYCSQSAPATDFYPFISSWSSTQTQVQLASSTASDVIGTSTDMSLYYTYSATAASTSMSNAAPIAGKRHGNIFLVFVGLIVCLFYTVNIL